MWTTWILTSAVFLALYDVAKKASVKGNAVLPVLLVSSACGLVAYLAGLGASLDGFLVDVVCPHRGARSSLLPKPAKAGGLTDCLLGRGARGPQPG